MIEESFDRLLQKIEWFIILYSKVFQTELCKARAKKLILYYCELISGGDPD